MFNFAVSLCAANNRSTGQTQNAQIVGSKRYCTPYGGRLQSFDDLRPSIVGAGIRDRTCVRGRREVRKFTAWLLDGAHPSLGEVNCPCPEQPCVYEGIRSI